MTTFATPPLPVTSSEFQRVEHTRLRRRLGYGGWEPDLAARIVKVLGPERARVVGVDMSANPVENKCSDASALYDVPPKVSQADAASLAAMTGWTEAAQLNAMMPRVQRDTLLMREQLVFVGAHLDHGKPAATYEPVFLDMVVPRADPKHPSRPIEIREFREEPDPRDPSRKVWTQHVWSIDGVPVHRVLDGEGATDVSHYFGLPRGGLVGDAYPAIRADGRPILPYALFHAAITGQLTDPFYRRELVEGCLNVGVLWTHFTHVVFRASWAQRWISGGFVAGEKTKDSTRHVVADPATVLEILRDPTYDGQVTAGQWGSASNPLEVAKALQVYESRMTHYVDLPGENLWRRSDDPMSGVALVVTREGKVAAQRKYGPIFAPPHAELLSITATLMNRLIGAPALAEDGWAVEHMALPPSIEERKANREEQLALLDKGLITKAVALARITGMDLAEAAALVPTTPDTPLVGIVSTVAEIAAKVAMGQLPRDAGIAQIARAYGIDPKDAEPLLGSAGAGFVPTVATT